MTKPDTIRHEAIKMRTENQASLSQISRTLGISKSTASVWLRDYPLPKSVVSNRKRQGALEGAKVRRKNAAPRKLSHEQSLRRVAFEMLTTKRRGTIGELEITLRFLRQGLPVLVPYGDNERYDLVVERKDGFKKIQCKTGKYSEKDGTLTFATSSSPRNGARQPYKGQVDFFGVYCAALNTCYLVDASIAGTSTCCLRVHDTLNSQTEKVLWATDYEF